MMSVVSQYFVGNGLHRARVLPCFQRAPFLILL